MVTTQKRTKSTSTSTRKKSRSKASSAPTASMSDVFTSGTVKGIVLILILAFNAIILKNSFLMAIPHSAFSGNSHIDGLLYGLAISVLMAIVLFHEERWHNAFCPGAITLYLDTCILVLYTKWFEWLIGTWWSLWLMNGLMIIMPVMGLFIMVIMLKK